MEEVIGMTRAELIRMFVLNECSDDYEDIERIANGAVDLGSKCGLTISHQDLIQALRELIEMGYMKAWDLTKWPDPVKAEDRGTPRDEITPLNPAFVRTEEGIAFHQANATSGPFNEEYSLRESWLAPDTSLRRQELVCLFILGAYGPVTHLMLRSIEMLWSRVAERHGINIARSEFIQALRELVGLGYLEAVYRDQYWQYDGMPPLDDIKPFGAYFWVTDDGSDFHEANVSGWPFEDDDRGEFTPREDWIPPQS